MALKDTLKSGVTGLIDTALGAVVGLVAGLFGKSPTKKAIEAMQTNANALVLVEQDQSRVLKYVLYGFLALAGVVIFIFVLRKRK